ncbi:MULTISPECIES: hypothetical protein [Paenibacillus]|uniref:hypothetical protein n=1 Tax=Paenibacillus TaxID=44249 RepID=UPI0015C314D7|nr:hypothetical protein [Paenibacillus lautus]
MREEETLRINMLTTLLEWEEMKLAEKEREDKEINTITKPMIELKHQRGNIGICM